MRPPPRALHFRCHGHRHLRATHGKTLEWTREAQITPRATCVVGVAADFEPREMARLRGPLRITMRVPGLGVQEEVHATATPLMAVRDSLVVRKSDERGGRTFAYSADRGAADLDRGFVAALADPGAVLEVILEELPAPDPTLCGCLLLACPPAAPESPEGYRGGVSGGEPTGEAAARLAAVDGTVTVAEAGKKGSIDALVQRLRQGERIALVGDPLHAAARQLAGQAMVQGITVSPVWGVAPWQAVAAVSSADGGGGGGRSGISLEPEPCTKAAQLRRILEAARGALGVTILQAEMAPGVVLQAIGEAFVERAEAPEPPIIVGRGLLTGRERLLRGTVADLLRMFDEMEGRGARQRPESLAVALPPKQGADGLGSLAPVLTDLQQEGVPVRTLAAAAAKFPGVGKREAYQELLRLEKARQGEEDR